MTKMSTRKASKSSAKRISDFVQKNYSDLPKKAKQKTIFKDLTEAENYSRKRNLQFSIFDFDHKRYIKVIHADGSSFKINNFKLETGKLREKKNLLMRNLQIMFVYSEHHQPMVFSAGDLIKTKIEKNKPHGKRK